MGCGCSKARTFTESSPLMLGEPNGDPVVQYRNTVSIMGLKANSTFWATGSGVAAMVSAGWLVVV